MACPTVKNFSHTSYQEIAANDKDHPNRSQNKPCTVSIVLIADEANAAN